MRNFLFWVFVLVVSVLQASFLTIPVCLAFIIVYATFRRSAAPLFLAFVAGLVIDIFTVQTIGKTSLFFVAVSFLVIWYGGKFETNSPYFVTIATFFSCLVFMIFLGYNNAILGSLVCSAISFVAFIVGDTKLRKVRFSL